MSLSIPGYCVGSVMLCSSFAISFAVFSMLKALEKSEEQLPHPHLCRTGSVC
jgi:hypothetical protein